VSITFEGVASPYLGTIAGTLLPFTQNGVQTLPPLTIVSDSRLETYFNSPPYGESLIALLTRCECYDGNSNSGDGCDDQCQVDACFNCTADPSVCSPVSDGTGCDDLRDCTNGTTCSAGVCGGGAPVPSCTDMTGKWLLFTEGEYVGRYSSFSPRPSVTIENLIQRDGEVGMAGRGTGTIDTTTGEFALSAPGWLHCDTEWPFHGQMAADGLSFDGKGWWWSADSAHFCFSAEDLTVRGFRCGGGVVDTGAECLVDSCMQCTGDPSVCVPLPDTTPCRHDDPCTAVATCRRGTCVANVSDLCPACSVCDGAGGCTTAPRNNCLESSKPDSGQLKVTSPEGTDRSSMRWRWSKGEETGDLDIGHPDINSQLTLCLFSESTPEPQLVLQKSFSPLGSCADPIDGGCGPRRWVHKPDGSMTYREGSYFQELTSSWKLKVGKDGKSAFQMRTNGYDTIAPFTSFATPLRAQVQIDGGSCFDLPIDATGVNKNGNGVFSARGTP